MPIISPHISVIILLSWLGNTQRENRIEYLLKHPKGDTMFALFLIHFTPDLASSVVGLSTKTTFYKLEKFKYIIHPI